MMIYIRIDQLFGNDPENGLKIIDWFELLTSELVLNDH